eukprot:1574525-Pyramimonas_sp.AAC.2
MDTLGAGASWIQWVRGRLAPVGHAGPPWPRVRSAPSRPLRSARGPRSAPCQWRCSPPPPAAASPHPPPHEAGKSTPFATEWDPVQSPQMRRDAEAVRGATTSTAGGRGQVRSPAMQSRGGRVGPFARVHTRW